MSRSAVRRFMSFPSTAKPQARNISKRPAGYTAELRDKRIYRLARQAAESK